MHTFSFNYHLANLSSTLGSYLHHTRTDILRFILNLLMNKYPYVMVYSLKVFTIFDLEIVFL